MLPIYYSFNDLLFILGKIYAIRISRGGESVIKKKKIIRKKILRTLSTKPKEFKKQKNKASLNDFRMILYVKILLNPV